MKVIVPRGKYWKKWGHKDLVIKNRDKGYHNRFRGN